MTACGESPRRSAPHANQDRLLGQWLIGFLMVSIGLMLSACASDPTATKKRKNPPRPVHDWVMELRTEAATLDSSLEITPLQDPLLTDLLEQARVLEAKKQFDKADKSLLQAMALSPDDPKLLQWRAELALARKQWQAAHDLASRSYALGPKLGELCVRNQWTIAAFHYEFKRDADHDAAKQRAAACKIDSPPRY